MKRNYNFIEFVASNDTTKPKSYKIPKTKSKDDIQRLFYLAHQGSLKDFKKKLSELKNQSNFDINILSRNGDSLLMKAIKRGHVGKVKILLDNGCDPNLKNNKGDIPLFQIVNSSFPSLPGNIIEKIVKHLITFGANINDINNQGICLLDVINQNQFIPFKLKINLQELLNESNLSNQNYNSIKNVDPTFIDSLDNRDNFPYKMTKSPYIQVSEGDFIATNHNCNNDDFNSHILGKFNENDLLPYIDELNSV